MKKYVYILAAVSGAVLGVTGALTALRVPLAAAAAVMLLVLVLSDFQRATWLVSLFVVIDYIFRHYMSISTLPSIWDDAFLLFCIVLWLGKWVLLHVGKPYRWTPLDMPIALFAAAGLALLVIKHVSLSIGIAGFRAVMQYLLWYFVVVQLVKTRDGTRKLLYILVITGILMGLHGIYQYAEGVYMPANWVDAAEASNVRTRVYSILTSPNILGSLMVLLIPICVSFISFERKLYKKVFFASGAAVMTVCLIFTLSRMAMLGLVLSMLIYCLMRDKRLILPLIAAAALILLVPAVGSRFAYALSPEYIISSLKGGRFIRWLNGLEILKNNLFFGVGLGRFGGAVAANYNVSGTFYMDNYYLKIAVEMGICGLLAFTALIYNVFAWSARALVKLREDRYRFLVQGMIAGMAGVAAHNLVENVFEVPMMVIYFWVTAGIIMFLGYAEMLEQQVVGEGQWPTLPDTGNRTTSP